MTSRCWKFTHSSRQERLEGRRGVEERGPECWEQPGRTINHAGEATPQGQSSKASTVDRIADEGGAEGGEWFGTRVARKKKVCVRNALMTERFYSQDWSYSRKCLCLKEKIFTQKNHRGPRGVPDCRFWGTERCHAGWIVFLYAQRFHCFQQLIKSV